MKNCFAVPTSNIAAVKQPIETERKYLPSQKYVPQKEARLKRYIIIQFLSIVALAAWVCRIQIYFNHIVTDQESTHFLNNTLSEKKNETFVQPKVRVGVVMDNIPNKLNNSTVLDYLNSKTMTKHFVLGEPHERYHRLVFITQLTTRSDFLDQMRTKIKEHKTEKIFVIALRVKGSCDHNSISAHNREMQQFNSTLNLATVQNVLSLEFNNNNNSIYDCTGTLANL
jgi:hypothetical protein